MVLPSRFGRLALVAAFLGSLSALAAQQIQPANEPSAAAAATAAAATAATATAGGAGTSQETPAAAGAALSPQAAPQAPEWAVQLSAEEQKYIEQLLEYWQSSSQQIRQCTCEFTKWSYDPAFCNYRNPQTNELAAYKVCRGVLKYAAPDKAFYESTEAWQFTMNQQQQPDLVKSDTDVLYEKWICDGQFIFNYNFAKKVLSEMKIPEPYQRDGLINSPLPFLFGADRQTMLNRFWIHVITPASATDEYWLEAVPKRLEDARNYSRVHVIIARQDFLPKSIIIFPIDYDPLTRPASDAYLFENRRINSNLDKLKDFLGMFVRPSVPLGWTREELQSLGEDSVTAQREEMRLK